jgi:hypothetical protein
VGYFQMRESIWNQRPWAAFSDEPDLQIKWFIAQLRRDGVGEPDLPGHSARARSPSAVRTGDSARRAPIAMRTAPPGTPSA